MTNGREVETLVTVSGIYLAFSVAVLVFRVQRESEMEKQAETTWIPWADRLLFAVGACSTIVIALALAGIPASFLKIMVAGELAATMFILFYPLALLAHYRLILRGDRHGPRDNPEPGERVLVWIAVAIALLAATVRAALG
jgi:hypothetical protein